MRNHSKLINFLSRDRKILYIILSIVIISVLTLTVVYAALSTTLNINGNAEVTAASWDIHLDNVQLNSNSATTTAPTITDPKTATFSTTLTKPGDFYEFTIDVVNNGSIDAMIDSVTKTPTLTETQAKYLNYIVEYQNGESINTKQLVAKNSFVRLKVKVEFRKDISASDLPTASETLNLSFTVNYVQSDETGTSVTNNGVEKKNIEVVNGDLETVGSEVCIDTECFYIISSDTDSVTMLAKYNLYIGNECVSDSVCTSYDDATGIQDPTMIGRPSNLGYPRKGTTAFGTNTIYSGSIVETYVDYYHNYLKTLDVDIEETRLITMEEVEKLGCSSTDYSCASAKYKWVYSTSYWTETAVGITFIWRVTSDCVLGCNPYDEHNLAGVRPVITVSKSEF